MTIMKPDINTAIRLTADMPTESLKKGAIGVIVAIFTNPNEAYEVEFCDDNGESIAQVALLVDQFECIPEG